MADIPKFLVRVTRMYISKCQELGTRPIDAVLPPRLREASDEFKKRAAPLFRFLEEASKSAGEYELANAEDLVIIMHRLIEKGVNPVALSVDVAAIKRDYAALNGSPARLANPDLLLDMYHVTMDDIKASFRQWMQISGELPKNIPNIQLQENYKPSARDFKLGVASGVIVGQKELKTLCWFGIRKSSAQRGPRYDLGAGDGD
jgi:hypothetical protein